MREVYSKTYYSIRRKTSIALFLYRQKKSLLEKTSDVSGKDIDIALWVVSKSVKQSMFPDQLFLSL